LAIETALYRIVHEALNNVGKHARATAVNVRIFRESQTVHCSVIDNGTGFDTEEIDRKIHHGIGLLGIEHRLKVLGGRLDLKSEPGRGTQMFITIPLET